MVPSRDASVSPAPALVNAAVPDALSGSSTPEHSTRRTGTAPEPPPQRSRAPAAPGPGNIFLANRPPRQTVSGQQALRSQAGLEPWLPPRLSRAACRGRGRATMGRGSRRLKFRIIATVSTTTSPGLLILAQPLRRRAPFPTSPAAPCASDNPCGF